MSPTPDRPHRQRTTTGSGPQPTSARVYTQPSGVYTQQVARVYMTAPRVYMTARRVYVQHLGLGTIDVHTQQLGPARS